MRTRQAARRAAGCAGAGTPLASRSVPAALAGLACLAAAAPVCAQSGAYTYVQMSLGVPWFLYFVFLACVSIPFVVMIVLAWRKSPADEEARAAAAAAPPDPPAAARAGVATVARP